MINVILIVIVIVKVILTDKQVSEIRENTENSNLISFDARLDESRTNGLCYGKTTILNADAEDADC